MDLLHGSFATRIGLHMPANRFNGYTDYGVGIGLRVPHYEHIFSKKPVVDWFEIISENYMVDGGSPLRGLDQILDVLWERAAVEPRPPQAHQGSDEAHQASVAFRSSLLGQRRWTLYPRPL